MELAMRCRDSGGGQCVLVFCGSEWTAAARVALPTVALLARARQRRLGLGFKGVGKVGSIFRVRTVIVRRYMARARPRSLRCMPYG